MVENKQSNTVVSDKKAEPSVPWFLSCRWTLVYVGFLGAVSFYLMRLNMSVGVVCMTRDDITDVGNNVSFSYNVSEEYQHFLQHLDANCPQNVEIDDAADLASNFSIRREIFDWSRQMRGWILSSYSIGYIPMQLPSAFLARRFGAKRVLFIGGLLTTVATFLTPEAARFSVYLLMVLQVIKGIGHATYHPCISHLWSSWAPPQEKTKLSANTFAGNSLGSVLGFAVSGLLCEYGFDGGWPSLFYIYGLVGLLFLVLWHFFVFDSPQTHPRIKPSEKKYIMESTGIHVEDTSNTNVPWVAIARCPRVWAILIADFAYSWVLFVFLTTLPQYMKDILRFDIKKNGILGSLPYLLMFILTFVVSYIVDTVRAKGIISTLNVRKIVVTLALFVPTLTLLIVAYLDCTHSTVVVALLCVTLAFVACNRSGTLGNEIDIAQRYAGILMGIVNTTSNIPGFVVPAVTAALTPMGLPSEWKKAFFLSCGVQVAGGLVFVLFASADVQEWAKVKGQKIDMENGGILPKDDLVEKEAAEMDSLVEKKILI